ncbi:MAG: HAD family phosphatase [Verrucomicrobiota bacterium]|nr:HAD family phosphatase [Verrucomicrobiota bacterium]
MPVPPTAALFDIGNVLVEVDFARGLTPLVPPEAGPPHLRLRSLLEKCNELETGRVTPDEFIAMASECLAFTGPAEEFRDAWNSIFRPLRSTWSVVSFLRSLRLKLILFSNTNCMHLEWLLTNYEIFEEFGGQVFSHEVGFTKPDPAIYHHAITEFNLTPEETLYIDDLPENIATGHTLGLRCHQYSLERHHEFIAWLDQEFGLPGGGAHGTTAST